MALAFSIEFDLSDLYASGPVARAGVLGGLSSAVQRVVSVGEDRWKRAIQAQHLWSGEIEAYQATITSRMTGPYSGEIVSNYRYVEDIESGRPAYDMKRMLDTSMKVRRTKSGKKYLIIPFRHNTPGNTAHARAMPKEIYESAKELAPSKITAHGVRPSGHNVRSLQTHKQFMVRSRKYQWGDRLAPEPDYHTNKAHKSDPYAGMVRFKESTGGSMYLTFRVMMEGSSGWIKPAKAGLWIAKGVADSLREQAGEQFAAAITADI